ncbi:MAG: type I DNA topoisomerase [Pseudolabrys sp.]|nr:type I DNA topoisomerase [Pseudolabrys sp.]
MKLVVVESPTKAKKIGTYLGKDYEVIASYGHVRDLPPKDGSVLPDDDFAMSWEVDTASRKRLADIGDALKNADELILATDPDREGEAISWHVLDILKSKKLVKDKPVSRVVFNAITKSAITEAMQNPRDIDVPLVDAYLARRALDYLVGFTLSPILWRKLPGSRSAGRVQSVTLRLVCDREAEIEKFRAVEYWSVAAKLSEKGKSFDARLYSVDGKVTDKLDVKTGAEAEVLKAAIEAGRFEVLSVDKKPTKRNPYAPFTTSSLQQDASSRLGFSPSRTMQLAQRLYEDGAITYMRTDGIDMAPEAISDIRTMIGRNYGSNYVPSSPRVYQNKSKNAQEAHEAVRPTSASRTPAEVAKYVDRDQARLYELVWNRAVASQMEAAELERTTVDIAAKAKTASGERVIDLRASGQVVKFDGFLTLYQEGQDEASEDDESRRLPAMAENEKLTKQSIDATQHFTEPPPRFSEAALVKRMEELGIGRPSTYASVLQVLQDRGYVRLDKKRLIPEDKGRVVVAFLESFFARYVEYDFTADLEEKLDKISNGEIDWRAVLTEFWDGFIGSVNDIKDLRITQVLDALNELLGPHIFPARADGGDPRQCPNCGNGKLSLKVGRFGAFIGCSNYPECNFTRQMTPGGEGAVQGTKVLGKDPETGLDVTLRSGRFGPYLQLGEQQKPAKKGEVVDKPKRAGLPKGVSPDDIDLDKALGLLSLPRDVGASPEDGEMIVAGIGRFGPYVKHGKVYASLEDGDDVLTVGLNRAVTLIAEKIANPKKGRRFGADPGRSLGDHPDKGGPVVVKKGRFGPYVSNNGVNATIPADKNPEELTLTDAVVLLDARAAQLGNSPRKGKAAAKGARSKATKSAAKSATKSPPTAPDAGDEKPEKAKGAVKSAAKPAAKAKAPAKTPTKAPAKAKPSKAKKSPKVAAAE